MTRLSFTALVLCLLAGCSGSKEGPSTSPNPLSSRDAGFCDRWAEAACNDEVVRECAVQGLDTERCIDDQRDFCLARAPAGQYALDAAQACLDAVAAAYADARLTREEFDVVRGDPTETNSALCAELLAEGGEAPEEGAACETNADCGTADLMCVRTDPSDTMGMCQIAEVRTGGQTCTEPDQICSEGFYCDAAGSGYCIERPGVGNECSPAVPCREDLYCDTATDRCVALRAFGETCSSSDQCETGMCPVPPGVCVDDWDLAPGDVVCADLGGLDI